MPALAQVVSTNLADRRDPATVEVHLHWPQPARCEVEQTAEELVLRFDQPVDYDAFGTLAPRLSHWVTAAFFGYDSMALKLAPGVRTSVEVRNGSILLKLTATEADSQATQEMPETATPTAATQVKARLQRLKAELLWSTGDAWEASELLAQMQRDKPQDVELLAVRSVVETRLGRWRLASAHLDRAAELQHLERRGDWPVRGSEHAPRAEAAWLRDRIDGGVGRDGLRLAGHTFLHPGLRLALGYEFAALPPVSGPVQMTQLITAGLRQDFENGSWLALRAGGNQEQGGVVAEGESWDAWGATRLTLAYRELRWDLPVLASLGARRDGIGATRTLRSWSSLGRALHGDISGQIAVHLERWTAEHETGPLSDLLTLASLRYVSWYARPRLSLAWSAQHLEILEHETGAVSPHRGKALAAALVRNQIHLLTVGAQLPIWRWLSADVLAGHALSVWGQDAAQFGAGLAWQPPTGFRIAVRYQRGLVPGGYDAVSSNLLVTAGGAF